MNPGKRILLLVLIMSVVTFVVEGISIFILYQAAIDEEIARLRETAASQAELIGAVSRFDKVYSSDYPGGSRKATLSQVIDAHRRYESFGLTGEFTLAERNGDNIVFLLSHRCRGMDYPEPVPFNSRLAEPMRRALSGESGTVIGLDYRGELVLAAHEPVAEMNSGIVVKIDISEIRAPFIRAALISGLIGVAVIIAGVFLFFKVTNPIIVKLNNTIDSLRESLLKVRQLCGLLPICASCKKIRDDKGYWNQIEVYIRDHSDVEFSHSLCPDCVKKYYVGKIPLPGYGQENELKHK